MTDLPAPIDAVLFDRDGTLVVDEPHNGDPTLVVPMPTAHAAVELLRRSGLPLGVVSNQSGIGRGIVTREQVDAVNARLDELLGPFDVWCVCPHAPADGCDCRKPAPGLILAAAERLGVEPGHCVVIGDIGADVGAARAAGAMSILVPTSVTLPEEVDAAPRRALDLLAAAELVLTAVVAGRDAAYDDARGDR